MAHLSFGFFSIKEGKSIIAWPSGKIGVCPRCPSLRALTMNFRTHSIVSVCLFIKGRQGMPVCLPAYPNRINDLHWLDLNAGNNVHCCNFSKARMSRSMQMSACWQLFFSQNSRGPHQNESPESFFRPSIRMGKNLLVHRQKLKNNSNQLIPQSSFLL